MWRSWGPVITRFGVSTFDDATAWLGLLARYTWRLCHGVGMVVALQKDINFGRQV